MCSSDEDLFMIKQTQKHQKRYNHIKLFRRVELQKFVRNIIL